MTTKNYLQIFFLFGIIGLMTSCSKNSDWNRFGLRGNVKTYLEKHYEPEMKFGEWENGDIEYSGHNKVSFDEEGNYQWIEYLDDDLELSGKLIPKRENGEVIEGSYYDEEGKLYNKSKITYNSSNELEFVVYDKNGEKTSQGKSLFKNNRIYSQEYQTFEDGKIENEYKTTFEYDKNENLISQKQTNKKGEISFFTKFKYLSFDNNNNWTKRLDYDPENEEEPKTIVIREYEYY